MTGVNYSSNKVPEAYKCQTCGATDCKLWREYGSFSPIIECAKCAEKSSGKQLDEKDLTFPWRAAAVPDMEGVGWWGAGALPEAGYAWWLRLPTRPTPALAA